MATEMQDAAREAQLQAEQAARQAQLEAQQAAREAQLEARQAAQEAQQEAREAAREARDAVREALRTRVREGGAAPGILVQPDIPPWARQPQIPDEFVVISLAFFIMCAVIAIGIPIARAFARRMDRRSAVDPHAGADARARLERIEHAVDAIAIEVERVSEAQRYSTKVLSELRALPEPNPLEANALAAIGRDRERER